MTTTLTHSSTRPEILAALATVAPYISVRYVTDPWHTGTLAVTARAIMGGRLLITKVAVALPLTNVHTEISTTVAALQNLLPLIQQDPELFTQCSQAIALLPL